MQIQKLKTIDPDYFFSYWQKNKSLSEEDKAGLMDYFLPVISMLPFMSSSAYYWQIYSNKKQDTRILFTGGAVDYLTPYSSAELNNSNDPQKIFSLFKKEDQIPVFTFITKIIELLHADKERQQHLRFTLSARIKNSRGQYIWNAIHYPLFYFDQEGKITFGMVVYSDISHLKKGDDQPLLIVTDTNNEAEQVFYYYSADVTDAVKQVYPVVSARENHVLQLLLEGKSSKKIAAELGIARNTVENHRQSLLKKFDVTSSIELISKVNKLGQQ
jgi:DNA-binding CsgD family transcriptional regulator